MRRLGESARRMLAHPRAPLIALILILLFGLGTRVLALGRPCSTPCASAADHTLIFDEAYYVNAARVIAGIHPPASAPYANAPLGKDPNAEHPQMAKLVIAGAIELFGDGPFAWRIGSVLFGLIAIVGMYALARAAGGSRWLASGAAAVLALDNMMLIHSRIATLDIYVVAVMVLAAACYLRGWWMSAGALLGIAGCMKLVGLFLVAGLVLFEVMRVLWRRRAPGGIRSALRAHGLPLLASLLAATVTFIVGVWVLDLMVPAYDPGTHTTYAGNPFAHIGHMISYAEKLKAVPHATGISSTPWLWLLDQKPISYARVAVNSVTGGKIVASRALFDARGEVSPFVMLIAVPAVFAAVAAAWRERDEVAAFGAAWSVGTFIPFVIQSQFLDRISYLYYVLVVLPGIYLVLARFFSPARIPRAATIGWAVMLIYGFIDLYPVRTLSGH